MGCGGSKNAPGAVVTINNGQATSVPAGTAESTVPANKQTTAVQKEQQKPTAVAAGPPAQVVAASGPPGKQQQPANAAAPATKQQQPAKTTEFADKAAESAKTSEPAGKQQQSSNTAVSAAHQHQSGAESSVTTTSVIVAQVSVPIPADSTSKELSQNLSKQIAHQMTTPGQEREKTGAENYATANLEKSINTAISQSLSASESQLAQQPAPAPEKKSIKQQLSSSIDKLSRAKAASKESVKQSKKDLSKSKNSLAHEAPVAMAEAISTAVAKELSHHAGDSMGQNQVANAIDAAVAKSRGNLRQEEINVKSIEVTTEIEHDSEGTPIAIHAAVIAVSEVPVNATYDNAVTEPLQQKSKSSASIAVAHVPITKTGSRATLDRSQSRKSVKEDHLSTSARQSLTQLNAELSEMKKSSTDKRKSTASLSNQQPLTVKSNPALAEPDLPAKPVNEPSAPSSNLVKSGSRISLRGEDGAEKKRVTVRIKNSGSRQSLAAEPKSKDENKIQQDDQKDTVSPETRKSLNQLNEQLAAERGLPLEKAASVVFSGSAVKQSLKDLTHRDHSEAESETQPSKLSLEAQRSLTNLREELKREQHVGSKSGHQAPQQHAQESETESQTPKLSLEAQRSLTNLREELKREQHVGSKSGHQAPQQHAQESETESQTPKLSSEAQKSLTNLREELKREQQAGSQSDYQASQQHAPEAVATAVAPVKPHEGSSDAKHSTHNVSSKSTQNISSKSTQNISSKSTQNISSKSTQNISSKSTQNIPSKSTQNVAGKSTQNISEKSNQSIPSKEADTIAANLAHAHVQNDDSKMDEEAALEAHAAAERLSQEYLATSRSAADPEARSNWREEQASKDQLSNPAVVPLTQTAKGGHHQSVKDLASDVKKSKQDLAHAKSKESVKATNDETGHARESSSKENLDRKTDSEHEAANHHRSVKELAGDAKQSHDVANSKHILAEHSEQLQQEESAALHKEHHHHSIRELAVEGLVADVKASLQSLTHVGNREHVAKLESPPVHAQADVQHSADPVKDTAVEEPPAETTVPIVAAAHESKVALVDEDTQPTAQHSIKNLLHIGEQKTQDAEAAKHAVAEVGSATHTEEQLGSAAPEHGKEETQHLATLETSVAVDVSKHSHNSANNLSSHHGSKNQLGNTETVQVTGSVDVSPAGVAADPQIRKSAAHLAKDVAHEVRSSARDLQHQVNQADNAESHVSNTTLNKAPTTKSTKSIAKEAVGHTKDKAAEQIQAEQHTATSRPNSASKTRSRPASAKKDASRPTSPPKATSRPASPPKAPSRKGSTTNLKKSPSTNVVKSTATLADRRRSGDAVTKPPTAGVSANNLAEHKASTDALNGKHGSTALAKGSINALHQSLQGDHGFGSRQTLNRTATSPRGSRQNVAQHAGSTNASSNQLAKGTGVKASASNVSKASAQNLSTTPRTSHPIIAQTGTGSVAALADAHTALAQSNRSLAEAKTGAGRSNATLTKTYTTTASTPALNQAGRAGSQNSVKAAGPSSDLQKEPSPQLRSGSQAASRSASASKLDQVEA